MLDCHVRGVADWHMTCLETTPPYLYRSLRKTTCQTNRNVYDMQQLITSNHTMQLSCLITTPTGPTTRIPPSPLRQHYYIWVEGTLIENYCNELTQTWAMANHQTCSSQTPVTCETNLETISCTHTPNVSSLQCRKWNPDQSGPQLWNACLRIHNSNCRDTFLSTCHHCLSKYTITHWNSRFKSGIVAGMWCATWQVNNR